MSLFYIDYLLFVASETGSKKCSTFICKYSFFFLTKLNNSEKFSLPLLLLPNTSCVVCQQIRKRKIRQIIASKFGFHFNSKIYAKIVSSATARHLPLLVTATACHLPLLVTATACHLPLLVTCHCLSPATARHLPLLVTCHYSSHANTPGVLCKIPLNYSCQTNLRRLKLGVFFDELTRQECGGCSCRCLGALLIYRILLFFNTITLVFLRLQLRRMCVIHIFTVSNSSR